MRKSGILMPVFSLPSPEGSGTFGEEARNFIDFLKSAEQSLWQILPLGPIGYGNSPYRCYSVFAGEPGYIDLRELSRNGLLDPGDLPEFPESGRVNYEKIASIKYPLLKKAAKNFLRDGDKTRYKSFLRENSYVSEYACFSLMKKFFDNAPVGQFPKPYRHRQPEYIERFKEHFRDEIEIEQVLQYFFEIQWLALKEHAQISGIEIVGDMPIYPAPDSLEVWMYPELFLFDDDLNPDAVAGVPPDYFSEEGQLWGNPVYDPEAPGIENWWIARIKHEMKFFDYLRIDHFRALESFWAVEPDAETARRGKWIKAPGERILNRIKEEIGLSGIIAEDLGMITDEVRQLRDKFDLPGMKILQFAFTEGHESDYLPHNIEKNSIVYTGTHDNNTTKGHFDSRDISERDLAFALQYLDCEKEMIVDKLIRAAWASPGKIAIAPLQDLLGLGSEYRINTPGTPEGNWEIRIDYKPEKETIARKLKNLGKIYFRNI